MAIYTANDQINGALRVLGVLAEGETPSAATSQDALTALNQMIDSWNTERLSVFATQDQVFSWTSGAEDRFNVQLYIHCNIHQSGSFGIEHRVAFEAGGIECGIGSRITCCE